MGFEKSSSIHRHPRPRRPGLRREVYWIRRSRHLRLHIDARSTDKFISQRSRREKSMSLCLKLVQKGMGMTYKLQRLGYSKSTAGKHD